MANLAMCRFQRHGHEMKSAWAGTTHMRKNFMCHGFLPVFVVRLWRMEFYPWEAIACPTRSTTSWWVSSKRCM